MLFQADTLDDALGDIMRRLLRKGNRIVAGKGAAREFTGVLVRLSDPRARFSRTESRGVIISFLGETLWYLSGSDRLDSVEYYIPKYRSFIKASHRATRAPGAYGPRLFGGDENGQFLSVLKTLKEKQGKSDTRQAVLQIFDKRDLKKGNNDVPCTTTLQFFPRRGRLDLIATMRSNDAYRGFPGDVFAFTFFQELAARSLGLELGTYSHFVGSLHLYENDEAQIRNYLNEGVQTPESMPLMPKGDPWESVKWLLGVEASIRSGDTEFPANSPGEYWMDLARLLQIKSLADRKELRKMAEVKGAMHSPVYNSFIRGRQAMVERKIEIQPSLPGLANQ